MTHFAVSTHVSFLPSGVSDSISRKLDKNNVILILINISKMVSNKFVENVFFGKIFFFKIVADVYYETF